ncbi:MAG: class I SAM-dependent methyltransferase [Ktedonobacterales bacterium]|nr:class I SAM-dependent methyltransferase [Ktedonobacterales bacterium]
MPSWFPFHRSSPRKDALALDLPERGPTTMPPNMSEIRRLDVQHFILRKQMGGNYLAPLTHPTAILDIACGTGRWAMEMATSFPEAQVTGFDILMPTPTASLGAGIAAIPTNVTFLQGDARKPLAFADGAFDFVHLRLLYGVLPAASWEPLLREVVRVTRPGGWIESLEALPFRTRQREGMAQIIAWFSDVLRMRGHDPIIAVKLPVLLRAAGLSEVTRREINESQHIEGEIEQRRQSGSFLIESLRGPVVAFGLATAVRFDEVATRAHHELMGNSQQSGFNTYVTYGRRD